MLRRVLPWRPSRAFQLPEVPFTRQALGAVALNLLTDARSGVALQVWMNDDVCGCVGCRRAVLLGHDGPTHPESYTSVAIATSEPQSYGLWFGAA